MPQPFVKWVGSKRTLHPEIIKIMPETIRHYWEPFVGGGAVFFALPDKFEGATLCDLNRDLTYAYYAIKSDYQQMARLLEAHKQNNCSEYYYKVRAQYNLTDPFEIAARMVYLNKTCFNGMHRVNKRGHFNSAWGYYENPLIYDLDHLKQVSHALRKAEIRHQSFEYTESEEGDVVYCDPPYDKTFQRYTSKQFGSTLQKDLAFCANKWRSKGACVILSNSDTPFIRELYSDWNIKEVRGVRKISCDPKTRGKVQELLIYS